MPRTVSVGLLGLGNIGSGVADYLERNSSLIRRKTGIRVVLRKDYDRNNKSMSILPREKRASSPEEIINDPGIQIFIELIGGYEPARTFMLKALRSGKHVVTANKAALARHGREIFEAAARADRNLGFEASVCGGIPIIKVLKENLDEIESFLGIVNGTTNFILTEMSAGGREFGDALREAQRLGYAEADPAFDIEGHDALQKLLLASQLAFNTRLEYRRLERSHREGITGISSADIGYARELGYTIKHLAKARKAGGRLELGVFPALVPDTHLLASVSGVLNAVYLSGRNFGPQLFTGAGAGRIPTSDAVVRDVVDIARKIDHGAAEMPKFDSQLHILDPLDYDSEFYLRFNARDRPGVLSRVSGILAGNGVSISAVIQKGRARSGSVPIVMTLHKSRARDVFRSVKEINRLPVIRPGTVVMRIEGG